VHSIRGDARIEDTETRPYLSIVVPAYNEEQRLPRTLQSITAYVQPKSYVTELIVVDDGSVDNTARAVEEFAATSPILRLIRNEHHGKAYAVRTGVLASSGQYVLFMDADGATPISELDKLLPYLEGECDLAIGSREGMGAKRYDEPSYRHAMGRVFNLIVRSLAVPGIQDTQCGFKAFRREAALDLFGGMQLYSNGIGTVQGAVVTAFDVEILFLARKWGYSIAEVPVHWYYGEDSKVNPLKDSWRNLHDVLRVRWNDFRGRYQRGPRP
jgi:dolichyl-phosphate beta-glucosyltransferase